MDVRIRIACSLVVALTLASPALAGDKYKAVGSATIELRGQNFSNRTDSDDVTGFFDLYRFTRNKDKDFTVDLGLSDLRFDLLGEADTPFLQMRLRSPRSNINLSGSGQPLQETFLNQRGELYLRPEGVLLDLDYHRFRTDELRLFPRATGIGDEIATTFNDHTLPDDRFFVRRTGIGGQLRVHPGQLLGAEAGLGSVLSEFSVRSGYERRIGLRQLRFILSGGDILGTAPQDARWHAIRSEIDQNVSRIGGGLVFNPLGLFTMTFDVDYERFREDAPFFLQTELSAMDTRVKPKTKLFGFVPDTDRLTASVRAQTRIGDRAVVHGGLQVTNLSQVGDETPAERMAGLDTNRVLFYSGSFAADVALVENVSLNAFFKYDQRRNRIDRSTDLFGLTNGTLSDEFLQRLRRIESGVELVARPMRGARLALGARGKWIDRNLNWVTPIPPEFEAMVPGQAVLRKDTREYVGYASASLRPVSGLMVSAELGFRDAPKTGYIRDLENGGYWKLRGSYLLPLAKPVTLSFYGNEVFGRNHSFRLRGETAGNVHSKDFERTRFVYGASLTASPADGVNLFASFMQDRDRQGFDLIRATLPRVHAPRPTETVDFFLDSPLDYESDIINLTLGGRCSIDAATEVELAYSFTRSNARFAPNNATSVAIDGASRIRNDIHGVEVNVGHWFRDGLRVNAGYRFDTYRDRTTQRGSGVVAPFNLSSRVHTVTLGVTLTTDLLQKPKPKK